MLLGPLHRALSTSAKASVPILSLVRSQAAGLCTCLPVLQEAVEQLDDVKRRALDDALRVLERPLHFLGKG